MSEPIDFRSVGFTDLAASYPRDGLALEMFAAFNGVTVEQLPQAMRFFPNESTKKAWERVASAAASRVDLLIGQRVKELLEANNRYLERARVAEAAPQTSKDLFRHRKGGTYEVIGIGKMQTEGWYDTSKTISTANVDMREVTLYRSIADGSLWVRPVEEFNDGRFEEISSAPEKPSPPVTEGMIRKGGLNPYPSNVTSRPAPPGPSQAPAPSPHLVGNGDRIADAIEACDWSGSPIGNKEILKAAVMELRALQAWQRGAISCREGSTDA